MQWPERHSVAILFGRRSQNAGGNQDQIIPPDQDAGAAWAGVVNYIDRQLCGPYHTCSKSTVGDLGRRPDQPSLLRQNLSLILKGDEQIELLHRLEGGKAPGALEAAFSSRTSLATWSITRCRVFTAIPGMEAIAKA